MLRRIIATAALASTAVVATAARSSALDCANVSRPAPTQPATPVTDFSGTPGGGPTVWVVQGEWWFITFDGVFADGVWDFVPPGTAASALGLTPAQATTLGFSAGSTSGNYQAGQGFGLLDKAQAPCNRNRQTINGIQAESTRCMPVGP